MRADDLQLGKESWVAVQCAFMRRDQCFALRLIRIQNLFHGGGIIIVRDNDRARICELFGLGDGRVGILKNHVAIKSAITTPKPPSPDFFFQHLNTIIFIVASNCLLPNIFLPKFAKGRIPELKEGSPLQLQLWRIPCEPL